jgi:hypothetical protein
VLAVFTLVQGGKIRGRVPRPVFGALDAIPFEDFELAFIAMVSAKFKDAALRHGARGH